MNPIEFGKFIAHLRTDKKLTQEELAEKLYIDKRKISRWECGTSIPDFDMLIKLSEILDVSLYELSICQKIEKEKLTKKAINKFKGLKDFKKYKLKEKMKIILTIILGLLLVFTTIYTIKFYGKVDIYEFKSLDNNYVLKGTYIRANDYVIYNISELGLKENSKIISQHLNTCKYEIFYNNYRLTLINQQNENTSNNKKLNVIYKISSDIELIPTKYMTKDLQLKVSCNSNSHSIKFHFIKKFDNKL